MIDQKTALAFSLYENKGVYALLLGSGLSRTAQIPTGWEITLDLVRRIAALREVAEQPDWAAWHKATFGGHPSYSDLLDQLAPSPDERRSILHDYIEPTSDDLAEGRKIPTRAHRAVARLVQAGFVRVVITTNFDRLIESALREVGIEPTVIASDDDLAGAVPLIHSRCYVAKVHGDYLDTRIRNTDAELASYSTAMNDLLDRIFDEHGLIICGWSGEWDPALRAAIARAPTRRYPMFWAARGKLSTPANDLVSHRGGRIVPIEGADAFFEDLERSVSLQAELQRPNPRSVELLVANAKKYVGHSEYRVRLDELIGGQMREVETALQDGKFSATGGIVSPERFATLTSQYEAISEPIVRVIGVLGRWGANEEFDSASDLISRAANVIQLNGLVILVALRTYPAVLLFYGYGIALLKARRYGALYRLFSFEISDRYGKRHPLVSHLFLQKWEGMSAVECWKMLPGLERHKTALSDHLHDIFQKWTDDYVFGDANFTRLFEEFELLASLAYLSILTDLDTLQKSKTDYVWAPIGRAAWDVDNCEVIRRDIERDEKADALLKAGFAKGEKAFLIAALANLKRFSWVIASS